MPRLVGRPAGVVEADHVSNGDPAGQRGCQQVSRVVLRRAQQQLGGRLPFQHLFAPQHRGLGSCVFFAGDKLSHMAWQCCRKKSSATLPHCL